MPTLTLTEYLDPARFPLTTQPGLAADQQLLIDAYNLDQMREHLDELDADGRARLAELQVKIEHQPALLAQVRAQKATAQNWQAVQAHLNDEAQLAPLAGDHVE